LSLELQQELFDEALRRCLVVEASWGTLTKAQKREMNDAIGLWLNAAEQGHTSAQFNLGFMHAKVKV
jgi:TPR repeat protein